MPPEAVANRLRALKRGEWLVRLPAHFGEPEPRPFVVNSPPLPAGHSESDNPLDGTAAVSFDAQLTLMAEDALDDYCLPIGSHSTATRTDAPDETGADSDHDQTTQRVKSPLALTKCLPPTVQYVPDWDALQCTACDNRYDPCIDGMRRAISCCSSLAAVDRDKIPICELNLKCSLEERAASEWSDQQLLFLQAVYNAQQGRYDKLEYDLLSDSMLRLQEYIGLDSDAVQALLDSDVLNHDGDHPHRLYSVTPEGRDAIGESYRLGVDYGHGKGDLEESSQHVLGMGVAMRWLEQEFRDNPDSDVTVVFPYYDLPDSDHRLDLVGLDDNGEIVVAVEVERINHDVREAAVSDFDKMAAYDPDEAIWLVMTQDDGHTLLDALRDPPDGTPRVEASYAATTPPQQFTIDTPGLTKIYPVTWLRDQLEEYQ
ncbi:hypothetical protein ACFPYI_19150 [Halomarina salina]|uniref:Uncharacterized protein n=1 Tax=Halomarina salina TaxID=1872699 RepID=A0ABD5RS90_9EURY|nr:hypothetical protein [Halomarina salina]